MIKTYSESANTPFKGTIIDLETIGEFCNEFSEQDSRRLSMLTPTMLGYLKEGVLTINYMETLEDLPDFIKHIQNMVTELPRPFYAFNCDFESSIFFHSCGLEILFDHELNLEKYEGKRKARQLLGISNYDDPYYDRGILCCRGWEDQDFENCIAHNRACLLKERDILLKRGVREPNKIDLIAF